MGPPLQDFLCAFEPSDWVFPVAHSANCCVQFEPTSEAAHLLNLQFNRVWNGPAPFRPKAMGRYRAHLARRTLSLWWPLNDHLALLGREDCTLLAWYRSPYAPRTGGAYDSHHRTAGIAGRTRRRGARAAVRSPGRRTCQRRIARCISIPRRRLPQRAP